MLFPALPLGVPCQGEGLGCTFSVAGVPTTAPPHPLLQLGQPADPPPEPLPVLQHTLAPFHALAFAPLCPWGLPSPLYGGDHVTLRLSSRKPPQTGWGPLWIPTVPSPLTRQLLSAGPGMCLLFLWSQPAGQAQQQQGSGGICGMTEGRLPGSQVFPPGLGRDRPSLSWKGSGCRVRASGSLHTPQVTLGRPYLIYL